MKFVLILVLFSGNGTASIAMAEFDDQNACENAASLTLTLTRDSRTQLQYHCARKSTPAPKLKN